MESILNTVKRYCGYEEDYTPFDAELIMLINSSFRKLNRLGVGAYGFNIASAEETWEQFLVNDYDNFTDTMTFVCIDVKLKHDTSSMSSYVINQLKEELNELGWQLNCNAEVPTPH